MVKLREEEVVSAILAEYSQTRSDGSSLLDEQIVNSNYAFANTNTTFTSPSTAMSGVRYFFTSSVVRTLVAHQSKIFCSNKETVVYEPSSKQPEVMMAAKQLQQMVNTTLHSKNDGYEIISGLLRSAAVNKNGVAKVIWEEKPEMMEEMIDGVDEAQLEVIIQQREEEGWKVKSRKRSSKTFEIEVEQYDALTGESEILVEEGQIGNYTLRLERTKGCVSVDVLPPEQFLINEGTTSIHNDSQTRFVGHRQLLMRGDIVAMFPKKKDDIMSAASSAELADNYVTDARHYSDGTYDNIYQSTAGSTQDTQNVELLESWIRIDADGDGFPEWRHCFSIGNTLLMNEEWFGPIPFTSFTFFPIPHKFYGQSVYDVVCSLEETATSLVRGDVDMTRLKNTYRVMAKDGAINNRTLNSGRPGVIPVANNFNPQDVMPLQSPQGSQNVPSIMAMLRQNLIAEVGIDPVSGQVSTDIEKSGNDAAKTAMAIDNASVKIESYARNFADGALRDIIWLIAIELVKNKDEPFVQQLVNSVSPGMPFLVGEMGLDNVIDKTDLKATVGLGHQTMAQKAQASGALAGLVAQLTAAPNAATYNLAVETAKGFGYQNPEELLEPLQVWEQRAAEAKQAQQAAVQTAQLQQQQIQQQMMIEQQEFEFKQKLDMMTSEAKLTIEQQKVMADVELKQAQAREKLAKTQEIEIETAIKRRINLGDIQGTAII